MEFPRRQWRGLRDGEGDYGESGGGGVRCWRGGSEVAGVLRSKGES